MASAALDIQGILFSVCSVLCWASVSQSSISCYFSLLMSSSSLLSWACSLASCSLVQQDRHDVHVAIEGGKQQCSKALFLSVDVNAVLVWAARCNT